MQVAGRVLRLRACSRQPACRSGFGTWALAAQLSVCAVRRTEAPLWRQPRRRNRLSTPLRPRHAGRIGRSTCEPEEQNLRPRVTQRASERVRLQLGLLRRVKKGRPAHVEQARVRARRSGAAQARRDAELGIVADAAFDTPEHHSDQTISRAEYDVTRMPGTPRGRMHWW
jgi:hypothetical protein